MGANEAVGADVLGFGVGTEGITDGATVKIEGINVGDRVGLKSTERIRIWLLQKLL